MSYTTHSALSSRALEIFSAMSITKDFNALPSLLAPEFEFKHDDNEPTVGRDVFLEHYKKILTVIDLQVQQIDHVVQVDTATGGGKAWFFSRILGFPGGVVKESVDMLDISPDGLGVRIKDVQRAVKE